LLAQLGWGDTGWSSSSQPIPKGRRFKQIFMLHDLPDFHADSSGDLFETRLLVCGHRNGAFWDRARAAESGEDRGAALYGRIAGRKPNSALSRTQPWRWRVRLAHFDVAAELTALIWISPS